jgi:hypothetical protein
MSTFVNTAQRALRIVSRGTSCAACGLGLCVGAYACDPGVFSRHNGAAHQERDSGAGGDASLEMSKTAAGSSGQAKSGSGGSANLAAGRGGGGGVAPKGGAGAPAPKAGAGGAAPKAGAGGSASKAGAGGTAPKAGGAAAVGGGGLSGAAGAGGASGPVCPPSDLNAVKATKLSDVVLVSPDANIEISAGTAVLNKDHVLAFTPTQADGALAGRAVGASIAVKSLLSATPRVEAFTQVVMPNEPVMNYVSAHPAGAWLEDGDATAVQFFFTRFFFIAALGTGIGRSPLANPAPAEVLVPFDQLFPAQPLPDGGPDPSYRPLFLSHALRVGELLYTYICNDKPDAAADPNNAYARPCRAARVLATQAQTGSSYEFWSDGEWVRDLSRATIAIDGTPSGLTVTRNAYLKKFLAIHSTSNNEVRLLWADAPQGPFHAIGDPIRTVQATGGNIKLTTGAGELPVPHRDCEQEVVLWYTAPMDQPRDGQDSRVRYETHVMRLQLQ